VRGRRRHREDQTADDGQHAQRHAHGSRTDRRRASRDAPWTRELTEEETLNRMLALLGIAALACGGNGEFRPLQVGDAAPAYAAQTVAGDTVTLGALRGH